MALQFGVEEAFDILEGLVVGGVASIATGLISTAVANLPYSFINASYVAPLTIVAGVLSFVGVALHNIRERRKI